MWWHTGIRSTNCGYIREHCWLPPAAAWLSRLVCQTQPGPHGDPLLPTKQVSVQPRQPDKYIKNSNGYQHSVCQTKTSKTEKLCCQITKQQIQRKKLHNRNLSLQAIPHENIELWWEKPRGISELHVTSYLKNIVQEPIQRNSQSKTISWNSWSNEKSSRTPSLHSFVDPSSHKIITHSFANSPYI